MISDQNREQQARAERTVSYVSRFGHQRVDPRVMELNWRRDTAMRHGSDSDQARPVLVPELADVEDRA
jgi:hypothetical protein